MLLALALDALYAGLAASGFAVLFNVPPRTLWACALAGALGHALRFGLLRSELAGIVPATFAAAVLVGALAQGLGRLFRVPWTLFAVTAAIPMVPGALAFETMIGVLRVTGVGGSPAPVQLDQTLVVAMRTGLVLTAIGVGIGLPTLLLRRTRTRDLAS